MMSKDANSHRSIFVLASLIIFIVAMAILLLIFVPKILVQSEKDKKAVERMGSAVGGLRFCINKEAEFRNGVVVVEGAETSNVSSGFRKSLENRESTESRPETSNVSSGCRKSLENREDSIEEVKVEED